jgi:hypothetical protein
MVDLNVTSELFLHQGLMQNLRTEPHVNELHVPWLTPQFQIRKPIT